MDNELWTWLPRLQLGWSNPESDWIQLQKYVRIFLCHSFVKKCACDVVRENTNNKNMIKNKVTLLGEHQNLKRRIHTDKKQNQSTHRWFRFRDCDQYSRRVSQKGISSHQWWVVLGNRHRTNQLVTAIEPPSRNGEGRPYTAEATGNKNFAFNHNSFWSWQRNVAVCTFHTLFWVPLMRTAVTVWGLAWKPRLRIQQQTGRQTAQGNITQQQLWSFWRNDSTICVINWLITKAAFINSLNKIESISLYLQEISLLFPPRQEELFPGRGLGACWNWMNRNKSSHTHTGFRQKRETTQCGGSAPMNSGLI